MSENIFHSLEIIAQADHNSSTFEKLFKSCLPQILLGPILNTLSQLLNTIRVATSPGKPGKPGKCLEFEK